MLDSRLKYLVSQKARPFELAGTRRFGVALEGAGEPHLRVLARVEGFLNNECLAQRGLSNICRAGDVLTGDIHLKSLESLDDLEGVIFVEAPRPIRSELDASLPASNAQVVHNCPPGRRGAGVVIGIIDTGIDWRHECFRDGSGNTRIISMWDQHLTPVYGQESSPDHFGYGVEYGQAQINEALSAETALIRSGDHPNGHGTHVAGIAAGNSVPYTGVAPEAEIIVVANLTSDERSLGDSARTLDAVSYIFDVAAMLGKPAVINLSQGDNFGPHDGTSMLEIGIDNLLEGPCRAMVKSAGNTAGAGAHASGVIGTGDVGNVRFHVPGHVREPETLEIWYTSQDRLGFGITPPGCAPGSKIAVDPGSDPVTLRLPNDNAAYVDSRLGHSSNGDNLIYVQLLPGGRDTIEPRDWTISLHGIDVVDGSWHAWVDRGLTAPQFVDSHRNDDVTISVPGTSKKIITVGSYITKGPGVGNLSAFSSRGPTRDGRQGPTIAAPGERIMSAAPEGSVRPYVTKWGTSMSAPHVAGAIALMFQAEPNLTQEQIRHWLQLTARLDGFTGTPANQVSWGAGKLDVRAAVDAGSGGHLLAFS